MFVINMQSMQNDRNEWFSPEKFMPERFDTNSPYYKRPDGNKRNPFSFNPFLGGKRICLGKTFAEIVAKELRIIPLTHTGSFDKVRVTPLTPRTTFVDDAEETDVTYTMYLPHGKPRKSYSYEMDTYVGCSYRCDCLRCRNPKKGMKKEWNRDLALNFSEGYDD